MAHSRISITLPRDVLVAADKRARELDRSRSWLIVEAIRAHVRESAPAPAVTPGLGPQRLAQLQSDLRLTPERRVRAAEENVRLAERVRRVPRPSQRLLSFDHYEDYVIWKRRELASP
jgi:predicted transcriptional regulator